MTTADLVDVVAIERSSFPAPWSTPMFILELSKPESVCLVSREGELFNGYLICSRYDSVWHVMNVAVAQEQRRGGNARRLMAALLERVDDPNARFTLEVRCSNTAAIALYESFDFVAVGRRKNYYQDNGEDAVIMWRTPGTLAGTFEDVPAVGRR